MKELILDVIETYKILKLEKSINQTNAEWFNQAIELHKLKESRTANELFKKANVISSNDTYPSALEAIAIQLGFQLNKERGTILEALQDNG